MKRYLSFYSVRFYCCPYSRSRCLRQKNNISKFELPAPKAPNCFVYTPYALRELVKAVYVQAPDESGGKRKHKLHIKHYLIGFIPVDALLKKQNRHDRNQACSKKCELLFYRQWASSLLLFYQFLLNSESSSPSFFSSAHLMFHSLVKSSK